MKWRTCSMITQYNIINMPIPNTYYNMIDVGKSNSIFRAVGMNIKQVGSACHLFILWFNNYFSLLRADNFSEKLYCYIISRYSVQCAMCTLACFYYYYFLVRKCLVKVVYVEKIIVLLGNDESIFSLPVMPVRENRYPSIHLVGCRCLGNGVVCVFLTASLL